MGYSNAGNTLGGSQVDARNGREKKKAYAPQAVTFADSILADLLIHYALTL